MNDCLCGHFRANHVWRADGSAPCNWCECVQYVQRWRLLRESLRLGGLLLLLASIGCTSFASFANTLNERQVQSCIKWSGFVGGSLAGGVVQVVGLTATGGATLRMCQGE